MNILYPDFNIFQMMEEKSPATILAEKVIEQFTKELTDQVFLYIQQNEDLLQDYLDTISVSDRKTVNSMLGKLIKQRFNVENVIDENGNSKGTPKSVLIKTKYTRHSHK